MTTPDNEMNDRELDAAIAERLLAEWVAEQGVGKFVPPNSVIIHIDGRSYSHPVKSEHMKSWSGTWELPHYSSSIADAMLVVEKMRKRGYAVTIMDTEDEWNVCFDLGAGYEAANPSLPRAICLAALATVDATINATAGQG